MIMELPVHPLWTTPGPLVKNWKLTYSSDTPFVTDFDEHPPIGRAEPDRKLLKLDRKSPATERNCELYIFWFFPFSCTHNSCLQNSRLVPLLTPWISGSIVWEYCALHAAAPGGGVLVAGDAPRSLLLLPPSLKKGEFCASSRFSLFSSSFFTFLIL